MIGKNPQEYFSKCTIGFILGLKTNTLAKIPINITDEWDFVKEIEVVLIQNGNEIFRSIDGFSYKGTNPFKPHDSRFPSWTLDLPSGVTDVYVRYHGIAFNAPRIILSSPEAFHDRMFTDHNIIGFILGMMLAIAFYNFGIFLASNDQTFAYYSLYLFLFAIFLSSVTGFIHSTGLLAYDYFPGAYLISMLIMLFLPCGCKILLFVSSLTRYILCCKKWSVCINFRTDRVFDRVF